jgi:NAD(P)-dependent dehydrogenase (short-subunit alcohol dehydrogenase family)
LTLLVDAEGSDEPIEPDLKILKTNLVGVMYTAKLAVHYLNRNPEGSDRCLIMTASLAGYLDQPGSPQYCASKWGVRGIMRSMRRTMPGMGMRVNIIAPWFIRTAIMSEEVQKIVQERGIEFADKADAAAAVLHMASDKSINGT